MKVRVLIGVAVVLSGCATPGPSATESPSAAPDLDPLPPVAGIGEVTDLATVVVPVLPRWQPGAGGIPLTDDWGEHPFRLEPPVPVSVVDGPVAVDGADWYRVYVLPDATRWPSDFSAWIPAEADGEAVIVPGDPFDCPDADVGSLAGLSPAGRLGCFGDRKLRFDARTWLSGHWVTYQVDPAWLGTPLHESRSIALFAPGGGQFPRPPDPRVAWVDARVPPDVPLPPAEVTIRVEARFDHPDARDCQRLRDRTGPPPQPAHGGLPDEDPDTSRAWCRGQLVVEGWKIQLGPEGRPPVAGQVQLHRTAFEGGLCAGVGMPVLVFRMDPTQPDPIWLEPLELTDGEFRSIPAFGAGFAARFDPDLVVIGPDGEVVARDGTLLNPDEPFGPYAVCPGGDTVTITSP